MSKSHLRETTNAVILEVLISPKAKANQIIGLHDSRLKMKIAAPPTDGKANKELIRFLAVTLDISASQIEITAGYTSKKKTLSITGITKDAVEALIKG